MGEWRITVDGGPAFWENAKAALELAALGRQPGPIAELLARLSTAEALYEPGIAEGDEF